MAAQQTRVKGEVYKPGDAVDVLAPALGGVIEGRGTVLSLIDMIPGGANGVFIPIYRVKVTGRRGSVVVMHDTLTKRED